MRLLKRYASRVVLAFDADAAGQGAAERFYEWEQKYQVAGVGGPAARTAPTRASWPSVTRTALAAAVAGGDAVPRLPPAPRARRPAGAHPRGAGAARRAGDGGRQRAPRRQRAQAVRRRGGRPGRAAGRRPRADRRAARARRPVDPGQRAGARPAAGERRVRGDRTARPGLGLDRRVAGRGAVRRRGQPSRVPRPRRPPTATSTRRSTPPIPTPARCSNGRPSPTSRPTPEVEARNLIAAAVRRELAPADANGDPDRIRDDREARLQVEELTHAEGGAAAAEWLLGWLHRRMAPRSDGGSGSA